MDAHSPDKILLDLTTFLPSLDTFAVEQLKNDYFRISRQVLDSPEHLSKLQLEIIYLAEGNANVVYKLLFLEQGSLRSSSSLDGDGGSKSVSRRCSLVLRVRKDTPFGVPYREVTSYYSSKVKPLFHESDLVSQCLISIPTSTLQALNDNLKALEISGQRPKARHGTYLVTDDPQVLLMEDMSALALGKEAQTIELKPKWLLQSPSAPQTSLRCRTCSLQSMRKADRALKSQSRFEVQAQPQAHSREPSASTPSPCPLSLLSPSHTTLKSLLATHLDSDDKSDTSTLSLLTTTLLNHPTLHRLRNAQAKHSAVGLSDFEAGTYDPLGMTARDCTLFIRFRPKHAKDNTAGKVDAESEGTQKLEVEVKLADLDEKSPAGGKLEKWIETEKRLVEEGWYEGKDVPSAGVEGIGIGMGMGADADNEGAELRLCDLGWGWMGDEDGDEGGEGKGKRKVGDLLKVKSVEIKAREFVQLI